jgi:thiamine biosynthesis protein ThiS
LHGSLLRFTNGVMIEVIVNGAPRKVKNGSSVAELLVALGIGEGRVAVERNRAIVRRAQHAQTALSAGDTLEVVHFVGGG